MIWCLRGEFERSGSVFSCSQPVPRSRRLRLTFKGDVRWPVRGKLTIGTCLVNVTVVKQPVPSRLLHWRNGSRTTRDDFHEWVHGTKMEKCKMNPNSCSTDDTEGIRGTRNSTCVFGLIKLVSVGALPEKSVTVFGGAKSWSTKRCGNDMRVFQQRVSTRYFVSFSFAGPSIMTEYMRNCSRSLNFERRAEKARTTTERTQRAPAFTTVS